MVRGTVALTERRTGEAHVRSYGQLNGNADVKAWYKAWAVLLASYKEGRLISISELKRAIRVSDNKIKTIIDALSVHDLPLYEENRGKFIYLGLLYALSVEEVKARIESVHSSGKEEQIKTDSR